MFRAPAPTLFGALPPELEGFGSSIYPEGELVGADDAELLGNRRRRRRAQRGELLGAGAPGAQGEIPLRVTSPYGMRIHPVTGEERFHNGIDLGIPQGTPLFPVAPGVVVKTWHDHAVNGHAVKIDHGNGWGSSYVHMSRVDVRPGQAVDPRYPIGLSGGAKGTPGAGRSTGPHLHLTIWRDGSSVDPAPVLDWRPWRLVRK